MCGPVSRSVLGSARWRCWVVRPCKLMAAGFADAEQLIEQTLRDSHIDGFDLRRFLTPLFWHEGRLAEARRLVETNWEVLKRSGRGGSDQAIELVRLHIVLSLGMTSVEALNTFLERPLLRWLPRMIGSGWGEPTWRFAGVHLTRRRDGLIRAFGDAPRTLQSGVRGWTGRSRRVGSPLREKPRGICPCKTSRRLRSTRWPRGPPRTWGCPVGKACPGAPPRDRFGRWRRSRAFG